MTLRWAGFGVAAVAAYLWLAGGDARRSETELRTFYSRMLAADFGGARRGIDEAMRLWPDNARYVAWSAYCISQPLPPQCERNPGNNPVAAEAAERYTRALLLNPRDAVAHHNLAWLDHLAGKDGEARAEWAQALAIDPDNAVFQIGFGMFLEESGGWPGARDRYVAGIELSPAILDSPFFTRLSGRHPDEAKAIVDRCIAETRGRLGEANDPILKARLGKLYLYTHDLDGAAAMLRAASHDLPGLPLVWSNLGAVYMLRADSEGAWQCFERARLLDGGLPLPYLRLGQISLGRKDEGNAAEYFRLATERWSRLNPVTAAHNNRLYGGPPQQIDDLLPTTLVWYVSPCEASEAYSELARMVPRNTGYVRRSHTCEELPDPHRFGP